MSADATISILRIELMGTERLIWRRVAISTTTNLQTLHRIVQAAMGWHDCHLWEFVADGKTYTVPDLEHVDRVHPIYPAGSTLARLVESGICTFDYTYDMGDNWEHRITIERVGPAAPGRMYPEFLGGERRCPPEDCGSVSGYFAFLDAIAGPDEGKGSRRKKEMIAWYGRPYDPDDMDEAQIRAALKRIARASSRRGQIHTP